MKTLIVYTCIMMILFVSGCEGGKSLLCPIGAQPVEVESLVAKVNGETITYDELWKEGKEELQLSRLRNYWDEKQILDRMIDNKILAQEARRKGLSVDEYEKRIFGSKVAEPSKRELEFAYRMRQRLDAVVPPFDAVKGELIEEIRRRKHLRMRKQLVSALRAKAKVMILREGPGIEVHVDGWPSVGPDDAPVTIVVFFDYLNPLSTGLLNTSPEFLGVSKDQVRYIYRDYPFEYGEYSLRAHVAAHCARDQGKYFPYSEKLLGHKGGRIEVADLKGYAQELGLDMKTFNQCIVEEKHLDRIKRSMTEAKKKGVLDLPAYFINGHLLVGPQSPTAFREIIEGELEKQKR